MATSTATPWSVLMMTAAARAAPSPRSRWSEAVPSTGLSTVSTTTTVTRFEPPQPDPRILRQLRAQLTMEKLLALPPLALRRGEIPLDLLYVDVARWDLFEDRQDIQADADERRTARREMEEWVRYPLLRSVPAPSMDSHPFAPNSLLRADAYLVRENMGIVVFARIRQMAASTTAIDRWVKMPVQLVTADGLPSLPERGFKTFTLRPMVDEELQALYGKMPPGFAIDLSEKITRLCTKNGSSGDLSDHGIVAELLGIVLSRYAAGLTAEEFALVRQYQRIYARRGQFAGFEATAELVTQLRKEEFPSLTTLMRARATWRVSDHLASLFNVMPAGFREKLERNFVARQSTPNPFSTPQGYRILAALLAEIAVRESAQLTDHQLATLDAHRARFEKLGGL